MIEFKKGDFIYSDADITGYSGSISRRYKVVEVYEDKLHIKNDTGYYHDIEECLIDINDIEYDPRNDFYIKLENLKNSVKIR